jgi:hypothetical protein
MISAGMSHYAALRHGKVTFRPQPELFSPPDNANSSNNNMSERSRGEEHEGDAVNLSEVSAVSSAYGSDRIEPASTSLAQHEPMQINNGAENAPNVDLPIRLLNAPAVGYEQIAPSAARAPDVDLPFRVRAPPVGSGQTEYSDTNLAHTRPTEIDNGAEDASNVNSSTHAPLRRWASCSDLGDIPEPLEGGYYPRPELASEDATPGPTSAEGSMPESTSDSTGRSVKRTPCSVCNGNHAPPHDYTIAPARTPGQQRMHKNWMKRDAQRRRRETRQDPSRAPNASATVQRQSRNGGRSAHRAHNVHTNMAPSAPISLSTDEQQLMRLTISSLESPLQGIQTLSAQLKYQQVPGMISFLQRLDREYRSNIALRSNDTSAEHPSASADQEQPAIAPRNTNAERPEHAAPPSAENAAPANTPTPVDPLVDFRTGSELALSRSLESGRDLSAKAAGKQARR